MPRNKMLRVRFLVAFFSMGLICLGDAAPLDPPHDLQIRPPSLVVKESEPFQAQCIANGSDPLTFTWQKSGQLFQTGSTLSVVSAGPEHNSVFTCHVTNRVGSSQVDFLVTVLSPPHSLRVKPSSVVVKELDPVSIECLAGGSMPLQFKWTKNRKDFQTGRYLTIAHAGRQHDGLFTCHVSNSEGSAHLDVSVKVMNPPNNLRVVPNFLMVKESETAILQCFADGSLPLSFMWTRDGQDFQRGSNLTIISVTPAHSGTYVCNVNNTIGSAHVEVPITVLTLPYNLRAVPSAVVVKEFNPISVECFAEGTPPLGFHWTQGGRLFQTGSHLTVKAAGPEHGGIFICHASNAQGNDHIEVPVTVTTPPYDVRTDPNAITVKISEPISVECLAKGTPPLSFKWMKDGEYFQSGTHLKIQSALLQHYAVFTCEVSNSEGRAKVEVPVIVTSPPYDLKVSSIAVVVKESDPISVDCSAEGTSPLNFKWYKDGQFFDKGKHLGIVAATMENNGLFSCHVSNSEGEAKLEVPVTVNASPKHMSAGEIAGIVCGVLAAVTAIAGTIFGIVAYKRSN